MQLIEPKFHHLALPSLADEEKVASAIEISICVNPEVRASEAQAWLIVTNHQLLLAAYQHGVPTVIKQLSLRAIENIQMSKSEMGMVSISITTGLVRDKIDGYFLGKEPLLEALIQLITESIRLPEKGAERVPFFNGIDFLEPSWFSERTMQTAHHALKGALVFSVLVLALVTTMKLGNRVYIMAMGDSQTPAVKTESVTPPMRVPEISNQKAIIIKDLTPVALPSRTAPTLPSHPLSQPLPPVPVKKITAPVVRATPPAAPADDPWKLE